MLNAEPTTHMLDVPGARLHYEVRGSGPLLAIIGLPMDSAPFAPIADAMARDHTVVTYDPRGIGRSTREDEDADITLETVAGDVKAVLDAVSDEPTLFLGSSGGAVTGLVLVERHPGRVRTMVAHEPPLLELLPDREAARAGVEDLYATYLREGPDVAMVKFMGNIGVIPPELAAAGPAALPFPITDEVRAVNRVFFGHLIRPITRHVPDIDALRSSSTRIVVGRGTTSAGQQAHRTATELAARLGTPPVDFPGDHGGFIGDPEAFAEVLRRTLAGAP
jgi:pimeloyl-ACP methyl ester carboxylesterase